VRTLGSICATTLAVALFATCIGAVAIRSLGMGTAVVAGGQMEPTIRDGSLLIVEPIAAALVARGDIIAFDQSGRPTTRRVVAVDAANREAPLFTTKADASAVADPEPVQFRGSVAVYRASIPGLGYLVSYLQAYWMLALLLIAAAVLLACAAVPMLGSARAEVPIRPRETAFATVPIESEDLWTSHVGWLRKPTF
jgi:signal peptidase I